MTKTKYSKLRKKIGRLSWSKALAIGLILVALAIMLFVILFSISVSFSASRFFAQPSDIRALSRPGTLLIEQNRLIGAYYSIINILGIFTISLVATGLSLALHLIADTFIKNRKDILPELLAG